MEVIFKYIGSLSTAETLSQKLVRPKVREGKMEEEVRRKEGKRERKEKKEEVGRGGREEG